VDSTQIATHREVEKWCGGEVEKWRSGVVEKWRSGEVVWGEKWRSGEVVWSRSGEVEGWVYEGVIKRNQDGKVRVYFEIGNPVHVQG
jgi:hypothetical protein